MENLDQWILAIIAVSSIVAPSIAALINNRTQYKISKLNTLHSTKIKYVNDYFEHLSAVISQPSNLDSLRDYLSSAQKLYIIVNDDCRRSIDNITNIVSKDDSLVYSKEFLKSLEDDMNKLSKNISKCIE